MGNRRKRKRRFKARTIWMMVLAYLVVGGVVAALFLQGLTAGVEPAQGEPSLNNAWGLFPLVVLLWPAFLVVMIVRALV